MVDVKDNDFELDSDYISSEESGEIDIQLGLLQEELLDNSVDGSLDQQELLENSVDGDSDYDSDISLQIEELMGLVDIDTTEYDTQVMEQLTNINQNLYSVNNFLIVNVVVISLIFGSLLCNIFIKFFKQNL